MARRRFARADIEPQEKPTSRSVKIISAGKQHFGDIKFFTIFLAVRLYMGVIRPCQCRRFLHGEG